MSKPLDRLTLLETFVRIVDSGSISAAARDLGLSQPSASRQLSELERRLQTQLVRRNTHSLAITDTGAEVLAEARQLLDGWEALAEKHLAAERQVQGTLKVVAPIALGQQHLARIAWSFQQAHPALTINWQLDDEPIKFAEAGCDCWVKVGHVPDETLIVRPIGRAERLLVASSGLAGRIGRAERPKQVEGQPFIALDPFEGAKIPLANLEGKSTVLKPTVAVRTNNIFAAKEAVLVGSGMAILPRWFVSEELKHGEIVDMLPGWNAPWLDIQIAYLPNKHQPIRLRKFIDTLESDVPKIAGIAAPRGSNA